MSRPRVRKSVSLDRPPESSWKISGLAASPTGETWLPSGYRVELGAAFLCADLALASEPRPDHAAYVQSWLKVLRNDKRAIFTAAAKAQVAADYAHERAGHLHSARAGEADQRAA